MNGSCGLADRLTDKRVPTGHGSDRIRAPFAACSFLRGVDHTAETLSRKNRTFYRDTRAEADSEMLKAWKTKFEAEARNA
jgi:hypothetical protein